MRERIVALFALLILLAPCLSCGAQTRSAGARQRGRAPASAAGAARPAADRYAEHVAALRKRLPSAEFSVVVQPPFVVVGDGPPRAVREHAEGTVGWAVERLRKDFFTAEPREIINVWLFKDAASYRKHTRELFGDDPTTPYGYYSRKHKALIMNIATGGGTLVHEIVHPFVEADFPDCPPWLNEGLGSLFEACADEGGHIRGMTNWRLPGLQSAVKARALPTFEALLAMDARAFYRDDAGTNYAQARYLLYYLQQKELLVRFYREFRADRERDPTGLETLRRVLGERDMKAFQQTWETYVLGLSEEIRLTPAP